MNGESTHYDDCWRVHHECAVARAEELGDRLNKAAVLSWEKNRELDRAHSVCRVAHAALLLCRYAMHEGGSHTMADADAAIEAALNAIRKDESA